MREADFQRWVVDVARRFGWSVWHVPAPMRAARAGGFVGAREAAGLPDLILMHDDPPRLVFAEVKGDNGRLSEEQRDFLAAARTVADAAVTLEEVHDEAGHDYWSRPVVGVHVLKPGMEDAIEAMLRSRNVG